MRRTPAYIVCSPRPQIGKTLLARLLSEFLLLQRRHGIAAFDINLNEPSLRDYLPETTSFADVHTTQGKIALMERLIVNDGVAKIVDVGFNAFDEFFATCEQIKFAKEAAARGVVPNVLFLADIDRISARAHGMLSRQIPAEALVVVDNAHVLRGPPPITMATGRLMRIAALPTFLKSYIDRPTFSFTNYLRNESDQSTELHTWIRKNYFQSA